MVPHLKSPTMRSPGNPSVDGGVCDGNILDDTFFVSQIHFGTLRRTHTKRLVQFHGSLGSLEWTYIRVYGRVVGFRQNAGRIYIRKWCGAWWLNLRLRVCIWRTTSAWANGMMMVRVHNVFWYSYGRIWIRLYLIDQQLKLY